MSEKTLSVSRRGFVAGASAALGAGLVGSLAGCAPKGASENEGEAVEAGIEGKANGSPRHATCASTAAPFLRMWLMALSSS